MTETAAPAPAASPVLTPAGDSSVRTLILLIGVFLLSYGIHISNGHYHVDGLMYVTGGWLAMILGVSVRGSLHRLIWKVDPIHGVLVAGFILELYLMSTSVPTIEMTSYGGVEGLKPFYLGLVGAAVLFGIGMANVRAFRHFWFPLAVLCFVVMARHVLSLAPNPHIDVWSIEKDSLAALFSGQNPFAITFPNPYGDNSHFFPPGVSVNGRLQFGFVYPPLCLLLCAPGYLLFGDPRYSMLAAMAGAALLMGYARPGNFGKLIAIAFLFMPRTYFVLDRAWTDPFIILMTALVVWTACRYPKWLFISLGLFFCLKQQMWIAAPAVLLLMPRPIVWKDVFKLFLKAGAVGLAITLPFALWDLKAFANSVLNIREVYRTDCLSILAYLYNTGVVQLPKFSGLIAMIPAMALGVWRSARTPAGFGAAAALTHCSLYIFSTHGFCNEWYTVFGTLCCGVACTAPQAVTAPSTESAPAGTERIVSIPAASN